MADSVAEDLKFELSILRPRKGDVLVVRLNENMTNAQVEAFMKTLNANASDYQGAFVLLLKNDQAQDARIWPESRAKELIKKVQVQS